MQLPQDNQVTLYVTTFCPYCVRAKSLLSRKGVEIVEINLDGDFSSRSELIRLAGGMRTVPQIFVGPVHVGGCDELYALDRAGKLEPLLDDQAVPRN